MEERKTVAAGREVPAADPVAEAAAAGELNLASWRVWLWPNLFWAEPQLSTLLVERTSFPRGSAEAALVTEAARGPARGEAARRVAVALQSAGNSNDLAWSWATLAAIRGNSVAAQAVTAELLQRARSAGRGLRARRLWRVVLSWSETAGLSDLDGCEKLLSDLRLAVEPPAPEAEPEAAPESVSPKSLDGEASMTVVREIPAGSGRDDRELRRAWEPLTRPLRLAVGPSPDVLEAVLLAEFPWLAEAVRAIVGDLRLRRSAGRPWVKWRPLLMVGPPGTGKTRLARRIAELVGTGFGEVNAAGSSDNRALQGTARGWASASPSLVLQVMRDSGTANPVMLVDEIDKPQPDGRNGDIRATLLGMLEPLSARAWPDEALMAPADLSAVNWLLCANRLDPLRGPLLSRLRVVPAPALRIEDFPTVLAGLQRDLAAELGVAVAELPSLDARAEAALRAGFRRGISIRRIRAALEGAIQAAGGVQRPWVN